MSISLGMLALIPLYSGSLDALGDCERHSRGETLTQTETRLVLRQASVDEVTSHEHLKLVDGDNDSLVTRGVLTGVSQVVSPDNTKTVLVKKREGEWVCVLK